MGRNNKGMLYKEARFSSMEEALGQSKLPGNKTCHASCRLEMCTVAGLAARTLLTWFLLCQFGGWTSTRQVTSKLLKCLDFMSESDRLLGMNGD